MKTENNSFAGLGAEEGGHRENELHSPNSTLSNFTFKQICILILSCNIDILINIYIRPNCFNMLLSMYSP